MDTESSASAGEALIRTTVGELCDSFGGSIQTGPFGSQLHASDYADAGTPLVMPQDMRDGAIHTDRIARVASSHVRRLKQHILHAGDVVFSRRGDVSRFAVVSGQEDGWLCGTGSIRIRLNSPVIDTAYLRRYFQQESIGAWLRHEAKGVTMPNLNTDVIRRLPLTYPPLPEQRRIAAILDQADALRAKRRAALVQLDTLAQAIFIEMFGDPATNGKGWPVCRLGGVGDVQGGLQVTHTRERHPVDVPYLRVANVLRGRLDLSEIKTIRATPVEVRRTSLKAGDLLVVEGHGNPQEIGRVAVWDGSVEPCVHQNHIIRVRLNSDKALPTYATEVLNSPGGRRHLLQAGKTTSGLNTISVSDVRSAPLMLPPVVLQLQFASRVSAVHTVKGFHDRALAEHDALFASLQHRAFRGQL